MKLLSPVCLSFLLSCIGALLSFSVQAQQNEENWPPNGQMPAGWATPLVVTIPTAEDPQKVVSVTAGWVVASDQTNRGQFSLKSAPLPDDPNAAVRKTAAIQVGGTFNAGTVSFAYKVSSEVNFDNLFFEIDGVPQILDTVLQVPDASGEMGWTTVSFPVSAGQHVFTWIYAKDGSNAQGFDAAWIDSVVLPAGTIQQFLGVARAGSGSGTITSNPAGITCGGICAAYYNTGTSVTLTATPSAGSVFTGWSGSCSGSSTTCVVSLSQARTATATFTLADDNFPPGGVLPSGWTQAPGSNANWQVVPNSASNPSHAGPFSMRSGNIGHNQTSAIQFTAAVQAGAVSFSYRVSSEKDYDFLVFWIDDFPHYFNGANSGDVPWTDVSIPVTAGTHTFKFEFRRDADVDFGSNAAWIDSVVLPGTLNRLLTVSRAGTGSGSVSSTPAGINCGATCSANFANSTVVTLTATPSAGSTFGGWAGACTGTGTCQVTMDAARDVTATFSLPLLTVATSGAGSVTSADGAINCGSLCSASYASGTVVTLTATPAAGNQFTSWSGACSGASTTCQVTMTAARSVTASFAPVSNTTTALTVNMAGTGSGAVNSTPGGINSCSTSCTFQFPTNSTVTLTAVPSAGSVFSGWSGGCTGTSTTCNVLMDVAKNVTATFSGQVTGGVLDADGSSPNTRYDALTDGLLILRYLFGLTGPPLTNNALGASATRSDPAVLKSHLDSVRTQLDIDGNGTANALTDGLLIMRYMFGLRGASLIANAVDSSATRNTAPAIESYIQSLMP